MVNNNQVGSAQSLNFNQNILNVFKIQLEKSKINTFFAKGGLDTISQLYSFQFILENENQKIIFDNGWFLCPCETHRKIKFTQNNDFVFIEKEIFTIKGILGEIQ